MFYYQFRKSGRITAGKFSDILGIGIRSSTFSSVRRTRVFYKSEKTLRYDFKSGKRTM